MASYSLKIDHPHSHQVRIELIYENVKSEPLDLFLPLWRPGRYERADFAKNVSQLKAITKNGDWLTVQRVTANHWRIVQPSETVVVSYDYYAFKMDAGNCVVDDQQLYFNFISCLLYCPERTNESVDLSINIPTDYRTATALTPQGPCQYSAKDYHELVDTPLLATVDLRTLTYTSLDHTFHIHINGISPVDDQRMIRAFEAFTNKQITEMDGFPTEAYHFIIQTLDYKYYHGVEHQNSTVLILGPNDEKSTEDYWNKLIGVASHELFHTWNVTRLRPAEMSPYRYHEEIQYDTGFITEGITTYFGDHFLMTSNVFSMNEYLNELTLLCNRHFQNFGRHRASLIEASQRLWIDGYHPILPSQKVSIYVKGALVSLILDINIRRVTNHRLKLLDVVKELYSQHHYEQGGYQWTDFKTTLEQMVGKDVLLLTEALVAQKEPLENYLEDALIWVGLDLMEEQGADTLLSKVGIKTENEMITDIAPHSPGDVDLSIGDKIKTINNVPFDGKMEIMENCQLGILRNGRNLNVTIQLDATVHFGAYKVGMKGNVSKEQISNREKWLST